jgi:hypothetical protein
MPLSEREHNFRMHFGEIRWDDIDWIHLVQDRDEWQAFFEKGTKSD